MKHTGNNPVRLSRMYRANRARQAMQNTIISVVALGATLAVGLTSLMV
ncbi:MAG: hypothetical protein ABJH63_20445 [Rhizobiaceae bacterium]